MSRQRIGARTPRAWLIEFSADRLRQQLRQGPPPADRLQAARLAAEAEIDGQGRPGTLGAAMRAYYCGITEEARERLDATIARIAGA